MTDRQLEALLKIFQQRMQRVADEYLVRMGEQIRDIGKLIPSAETRLIQLKRLRANIKYIQRAIAEAADASLEDVARVFEAIAQDNARFAQEYFGAGSSEEYLMQPLQAQYRVTAGEMTNLSRTTIESSAYRDVVDRGIQAAQAGVEDYNSAIRRSLREASIEGLRVVYPSGLTRRLDTAVRQNVLDGIRALNQANLDRIGEKFGANGVEISAHALCAEDHLPYQGRQYSKEQFATIQSTLMRPFGMWGCRHTRHPILLGISVPTYTEEELRAYRQNSSEKIEIDGKKLSRYQWSQQQRRIETAVRYQQDAITAAKASGDDVLVREAKRTIKDLHARYDRIVELTGLEDQSYRMRVDRYKLSKQAGSLQSSGKRGIIYMSDARFERKAGTLGQSYRDALGQRFANGDAIAQQVYDKFIPNGGAVVDGAFSGVPHYSSSQNSIFMNFADDAKNKRGPGATWFHEHGHFVDVNANRVSVNLQFAQALAADVKHYEAAYKRANKMKRIDDTRRGISIELSAQGDITHSVQDIFGGVIGKHYPGAVWGHSTSYWKSRGPTGACAEAFAHMFEASFDPNKRALMQKYLPGAWAEFRKMIGGIA